MPCDNILQPHVGQRNLHALKPAVFFCGRIENTRVTGYTTYRSAYDPCPLNCPSQFTFLTMTSMSLEPPCFDLLQTLKIAATPIADTDELLTSSRRAFQILEPWCQARATQVPCIRMPRSSF